MKIIFMSDWHLTGNRPTGRKDEYEEAMFTKLQLMFNHSQTEGNLPIICAGDLFDNNRISFRIFSRLLGLIETSGIQLYVIPGNHDSYFHNSNIVGTPLHTLGKFPGVRVLNSEIVYLDQEVAIHGYGFGVEPVYPPTEGMKNILVMHLPVFCEKVPFYMKGEAFTVKETREKFPGYDFWNFGDIHEPCFRDNVLVTGSMMRSTVAQKEYEPGFWVVDTDDWSAEQIRFPLNTDVWRDELVESADDGFSVALSELVRDLKDASCKKPDFKADCFTLTPKELKPVIEKIFEEVE